MCFKSINIKPYTLFIPVELIVKPEVGKWCDTEQIRAGKETEVGFLIHGKRMLHSCFIQQGPKTPLSECCWFVAWYFFICIRKQASSAWLEMLQNNCPMKCFGCIIFFLSASISLYLTDPSSTEYLSIFLQTT